MPAEAKETARRMSWRTTSAGREALQVSVGQTQQPAMQLKKGAVNPPNQPTEQDGVVLGYFRSRGFLAFDNGGSMEKISHERSTMSNFSSTRLSKQISECVSSAALITDVMRRDSIAKTLCTLPGRISVRLTQQPVMGFSNSSGPSAMCNFSLRRLSIQISECVSFAALTTDVIRRESIAKTFSTLPGKI
jgi:hypothetical protein